MFNKLIILGGLVVLVLIPNKMEYKKETGTVASDFSVKTESTPGSNLNINAPKITPLVTTNINFYPEDKLTPKVNNIFLLVSSALILTGMALVGIDSFVFLIKNKIEFGSKKSFFGFIKML